MYYLPPNTALAGAKISVRPAGLESPNLIGKKDDANFGWQQEGGERASEPAAAPSCASRTVTDRLGELAGCSLCVISFF